MQCKYCFYCYYNIILHTNHIISSTEQDIRLVRQPVKDMYVTYNVIMNNNGKYMTIQNVIKCTE